MGESEHRLLAFLHTAASHVDGFERLVQELAPGTSTRHAIRADLLALARGSGGDALEVNESVARAAIEAAAGATVLVCTCSTIGRAAEAALRHAPADSGDRPDRDHGGSCIGLRIDRPMVVEAVRAGRPILIAAALESTVQPTQRLIEEVAQSLEKTVETKVILCASAWKHFELGDRARFVAEVAAVIEAELREEDPEVTVVLAQASMAAAADRLTKLRATVLSSPRLGVAAALHLLASHESAAG